MPVEVARAAARAVPLGTLVSTRALVQRASFWALVAAMAGAALPASARALLQGRSALLIGVAVWGIFVIPSVAAVLAVSLARQAYGEIAHLRSGTTMVAVSLGLTTFSPVMFWLGGILHRTTHHRGLGGATFGFLALLIGVLSFISSVRLASWIDGVRARRGRLGDGLRVVALACGLLVIAVALGRALPAIELVWSALSRSGQVGVVDATVWAFCVTVGGLTRRPERMGPNFLRFTVLMSGALVALGIGLVHTSPAAAEAVAIECPLAAFVVQTTGFM